MNEYRSEFDTLGEVRVPAERLWGAQTQRSVQYFDIGEEKMPRQLIHALARVKRACAEVNSALGRLDFDKAEAIAEACSEIIDGRHEREFPLSVWQTGSGTQSNMNCNEVIANRASQLLGADLNDRRPVHPNDDVNMSQSSNDVFPTAMHVAAVIAAEDSLLPRLDALRSTLQSKADAFSDIVKIGRTHLQDATPLTLGQEISGWAAMLATNAGQIRESMQLLLPLAVGGTAVGTGLNAHPEFGPRVARAIADATGSRFVSADNKFQALAAHDALCHFHGALKTLAANLMKIANDVRWLASGPRCGIGEITIPANEPGSSIMPGKVNPTQAEALTMVACQVLGNDVAVAVAASQGNFELNVFKPVIIYNVLQSIDLLGDSMHAFDKYCACGIEPVIERIDEHLNNSLMLVTALNPHIGYEKAAQIAKTAYERGISLKAAAVGLGLLTEEEFDALVVPRRMVGPAP